MGLQDTVKNAAGTAIAAVGDLAPPVSFMSTSKSPGYDPVENETWLHAREYPNVPMVFAEFSSKEIDGVKVRATDQQAFVAGNDLAVTPKIGDRIHKSATDHWKVQDKDTDPATALWILHIRKVAVTKTVPPP